MSGSSERCKLVVLGSINMDLVARCAVLPMPGQTLTASSFEEIPGGKGANQAVAAARAGGHASMIGRVGDDAFAGRLLDSLAGNGIDVNAVQRTPGPSGVAMINVADDGENQIVVVPGANGLVAPGDVDQFASLIANADALLLQLEIPIVCVLHAIEVAQQNGTRVILDPAPVPDGWRDDLLGVDLICPNETEAAAITGRPCATIEEAKSAALSLCDRGAKACVLTLGRQGAVLCEDRNCTVVEPFAVDAVDSTASGDAFAGALAVRWSESGSLVEAVRFGNAAGALAASQAGAQPSLPTREDIERMLRT